MGEYVRASAIGRGDCFLKLLYSYDMHLPHTYVAGFNTRYTCINNGRSDPKQIDYMATTIPKKYIVQAKVAEATSTSSDHWPLSLAVLPRVVEVRNNSTGRTRHITNRLGGI